jgi:poly(U)-specific endoribonuclease
VVQLSTAIQGDAQVLPVRIREIVREVFLGMGFDVKANKVVNPSLFSVGGLIHTLHELHLAASNYEPAVIPTEEELGSLSLATDRLWDLDRNRLCPGKDYILNLQNGKTSWEAADVAAEPLFTFVDQSALEKPTYGAFIALLDNYSAATGLVEVVTDEEKAEEIRFLNLIMDTAVMQYAYQYMMRKGWTQATSREAFIRELRALWFGMYSRSGGRALDSSGFEHVFLGEIEEDKVVGCHNWLNIYALERKGEFNYMVSRWTSVGIRKGC